MNSDPVFSNTVPWGSWGGSSSPISARPFHLGSVLETQGAARLDVCEQEQRQLRAAETQGEPAKRKWHTTALRKYPRNEADPSELGIFSHRAPPHCSSLAFCCGCNCASSQLGLGRHRGARGLCDRGRVNADAVLRFGVVRG